LNIIKTITGIIWENIVSKFTKRSIYNFQIGENTYGNPTIITTHDNKVIIGKYCSIAENVIIAGDNHSYSGVANFPLTELLAKNKKVTIEIPADSSKFRRELPIIIGNDVWIGAGAIILPEVTVGDGAIIGAGTVVTHDVPPYAIVVGVPAKILRYRFTQNQINQLLEIAWWNWDYEKIMANIRKFYADVDQFINEFSKKEIE
jgi:virginiamycin A acetyltransferase